MLFLGVQGISPASAFAFGGQSENGHDYIHEKMIRSAKPASGSFCALRNSLPSPSEYVFMVFGGQFPYLIHTNEKAAIFRIFL